MWRDSLPAKADQALKALGADISPFGQIGRYSVRREFDGASVFLTGATGFIGSLVVELLLRTTDVARIYVLARGKRGASASERVLRLLHSGLFHSVRDSPELLAKVTVMEGDMTMDDLGLGPADQATLAADVHFVIHAASIIELEADVQRTLRGNYLGTKRLLLLAGRMQRLRAFVYISAAHANVNAEAGASVDEIIYPLYFGHQEVDHSSLVEDLMSLTPESANVRAQMYLDMWGFPNNYTLGKNLTEKLVAQFFYGGLPAAIVRPSMVCGVAGAPYPGYSGSLAGPGGQALAQAVGFYDNLDSFAMVPTNIWDVVPGDMVSSVVVASAAAVSAHAHIDGYDDAARGGGPCSAGSMGMGNGLAAAGSMELGGVGPLIVHAATSTTYPISYVESQWASLAYIAGNPPPFRLPGAELFKVPLDFRPDPAKVDRAKRNTAWKVWFAIKVLETLGQHKTARRLKWGHIAWDVQNNAKTDRNLFFTTKNLLALEGQLEAAESGDYMMSWTLRRGGWPRYIATTLAGMYRQIFGITRVEGPIDHDFAFIPSRERSRSAAP
ncbi:MAG: male sterility protein-domain-containing protein [Monoraphidium minutum]|nr:MAG: male sterility protein-domain-containing protein [Monoraphidium minutum]